MTIHTGLRKAAAAAAAVAAGVALSVQSAPAANAHPSCNPKSSQASDLSPSSVAAWTTWICGGGQLTGGAARMVSGAWFGAPAIVIAASGGELSATQLKAWENWDQGAKMGGRGAAKLIAAAYVGAPGIVLDQIKKGATPSDLSARQLDKVTFLVDPTSPMAQDLPLPVELPSTIEELLAMLQGGGLGGGL